MSGNKKGRPGMPPLFYSQIELPAEFDRHLHNSVAEFVACDSERSASVGE
jgi:hypothetical protein